jgi:hypothetical protein
MLEVVAHAAALALLIGAFLLPGIAIERAGWAAVDLSGLRALARAVLGIAATSLALFALALAGALRPLAFAVLALVCAALALRSLRRRGGPASSEPIELRFAAALALATAPFWVGALDYRIAWDAAAYHLALPKRYLEAGGFTQVPISVYAVWPHAIQLLYAPALWLRDSPLASALHTAFGVLALWAAQLGARASGFRRAGWFAAPLALANPVLLFELGEAYVDLALAFFFCAGAIFAARALRSRVPDPGALALAGVCGGACAAAKINGVLLALALALALVPRAIALLRARETRALARSALCYAIPVAASWLPWLARSAWLTGDPFHPLLYAQLGGPDWSAELAQRFAAWQQQTGFGRGLSDYLLLPLRVLVAGGPEYQRFGGRLGAHWLVYIPLAVALARRDPLARFTLAASGCYFALWALGSQQTRFLIPMLPALALATGIALERGIALARARVGLRCASASSSPAPRRSRSRRSRCSEASTSAARSLRWERCAAMPPRAARRRSRRRSRLRTHRCPATRARCCSIPTSSSFWNARRSQTASSRPRRSPIGSRARARRPSSRRSSPSAASRICSGIAAVTGASCGRARCASCSQIPRAPAGSTAPPTAASSYSSSCLG